MLDPDSKFYRLRGNKFIDSIAMDKIIPVLKEGKRAVETRIAMIPD